MSELKDAIILDSHSKNVQTKSELFGEMEFKYISVKDLDYITNLFSEIKDDKVFVFKFLFNQLLKPDLKYSKFIKLSDKQLIRIARDFIKSDPYIFKYFKETNNEDFYHNIRVSIKKYNENYLKEINNLSKSLVTSQNILKKYNEKYAKITLPSLNVNPIMVQRLKEISKISEQFNTNSPDLAISLKPIIEQNKIYAKIINEKFSEYTNNLIQWSQDNYDIFTKYSDYWNSFQKKYDVAEKDAIKILKKYKWFISPSMPLNFVFKIYSIGQENKDCSKDINSLFIDYFSSNNYKEFDNLLNKWKENYLIKDRIEIINDCILSIKNHSNVYNCSNIVLPTLIAQIDGIRVKYMEHYGFKSKGWKESFNHVFVSIVLTNSSETSTPCSQSSSNLVFANS